MKELTLEDYVITNNAEAGCPQCRRVFASDRAFDEHLIGRQGEGRKCAENPAETGLELSPKGTWRRKQ